MKLFKSKKSIEHIIYVLREIDSGYNNWNDEKIKNQIKAIQECGYEWFERRGKVGFKHKKTGLYLLIEGAINNLSYYSPEEIKRVYKEVWSKSDPEEVKKIDDKAKKMQEAIQKGASDKEIENIFLEE